jgi:hypothetical protein
MLIQAYRRKEPIEVSLTTRLIKFYLNDLQHVVADVDADERDLLVEGIPEAYRDYGDAVAAQPSAEDIARAEAAEKAQKEADERAEAERLAAETRASQTLLGSSVLESVIDLTGNKTIALGDVVARAHVRSELSVADWNDLEPAEREAKLATEVEILTEEAETEEAEAADALRVQATKDAAAEKEAADAAAAKKFVLVAGDQSFDLKTYDDKKLREFAKQYGVTLASGLKGDQIRQAIVDKLVPPAA